MKTPIIASFLGLLVTLASLTAEQNPNQILPNPGFELGENLQETTGTPEGWSRGGSDPEICQVATAGDTNPSVALVVNDPGPGYGEWYSNLDLTGKVAERDVLEIQWSEMFNIGQGHEMRVTLLFFDANDVLLNEMHFVVNGRSSGWNTSITDSAFSERHEEVQTPVGSTRLQLSLVSGGSEEGAGIMLIDNLTVASKSAPPVDTSGNILPNSSFEEGSQLDNPTAGVPRGWQRGGNDTSGDVVFTGNSTSPTHALAVIDERVDAYSEWYTSIPLAGLVTVGEELEAQWFEMYDVSQGHEMRLTFLFYNADGQIVRESSSYARGQSQGWTGDAASSSFVKQNRRFEVPEGAIRLQIGLASGGSEGATGMMVIDDLSIRPSPWKIKSLSSTPEGIRITWLSASDQYYTVEVSDTLSPSNFQPVSFEAEFILGESVETSFLDAPSPNSMRFYRVVREGF